MMLQYEVVILDYSRLNSEEPFGRALCGQGHLCFADTRHGLLWLFSFTDISA